MGNGSLNKNNMIDRQHAQKRIKNIVQLYKQMFPQEYKQACEAVIMLRKMQEDEFATVKGEHAGVSAQRALMETPEKLYMSLANELDGEELLYFKSVEGARWFIKVFPEFSLQRHA